MRKEGERIIETATEARAGRLGKPVLAVLVISLALVVAFYGLVYLGFFSLG